jgi:hypothetical protein
MDLVGYILFFLVIGVLLYIPGHWWAKRKLRNAESGSKFELHITSAGFALCTLMVVALLLGFSQQYLAPQTEFGKFVSTPLGRLSYLVAVYALTVVFGLILEMLGFTLFRNPNGDE